MPVLRRLGNKSRIAAKIWPHFPDHSIYIEMFFGAGGMFFNKPRAKYNFLNDIDDDVFNLYMILKDRKEELLQAVEEMPVHQSLFNHWKKNEETDPIYKAVRFLMLSNMCLLSGSLRIDMTQSKSRLIDEISAFQNKGEPKYLNVDFRDVLNNIAYQHDGRNDEAKSFIYADPPYLGTGTNYTADTWTEADSADLFDVLDGSGIRWAMSEFDHPFILDQAKGRGRNVIKIGERQSLKNRSTEILITNYPARMPGLFDKI